MALNGPILLVEDDPDDQLLLRDIFDEMAIPNPLRFFQNGGEALAYLQTTAEQPFLILCDVNMPVMNGLEFRRRVCENEALRRKSIPFVFLTTHASESSVREAYDLTVQGFYEKTNSFEKLRDQLRLVVTYWKQCLHPNRYPGGHEKS